jgi:hypothetical protein
MRVAGVDSLPGKDAPAAVLESWAGVIRAMLVRSHEQTAAASLDVKKARGSRGRQDRYVLVCQ